MIVMLRLKMIYQIQMKLVRSLMKKEKNKLHLRLPLLLNNQKQKRQKLRLQKKNLKQHQKLKLLLLQLLTEQLMKKLLMTSLKKWQIHLIMKMKMLKSYINKIKEISFIFFIITIDNKQHLWYNVYTLKVQWGFKLIGG